MASYPERTSDIVALMSSGYRAEQYRLPAGTLRHVMPVMGMRVWNGRLRCGSGVAVFYLTTRAFARAEARARELCDLLWEGSLVSDTYEVEGEVTRSPALIGCLSPRRCRRAPQPARCMGTTGANWPRLGRRWS